jgi:competence protein ComEC
MFVNLVRKYPVLRLLLPFIGGVLFFSSEIRYGLSALCFAVWLYFIHRQMAQRAASYWPIRWMPGCSLFLFWLFMGSLLGHTAWKQADFPVSGHVNNRCSLLVVLEKEPVSKPKTVQLTVKSVGGVPEVWNSKRMILYIKMDDRISALHAGDQITITCLPKPLIESETVQSGYIRWMKVHGICATAFLRPADWAIQPNTGRASITQRLSEIRRRVQLKLLETPLSDEAVAVVSAMSLGAKEGLSPCLKEAFSVAGAAHILSVSGLHVSSLVSLLLLLFRPFNRCVKLRKYSLLLAIPILVLYAFMTGLPPSVDRAVLMFSLIAVGQSVGAQYRIINNVFFSAFLLLLINPLSLYDLGFQLSYLAVTGIILLYPVLESFIRIKNKWFKGVAGILLVSLAAQLVTAPLICYNFGRFSTYFLIANLLVVPVAGLLIYLSFFTLLVSPIQCLFTVASTCLKGLTETLIKVIYSISHWPYASLKASVSSTSQLIFLYGLIICLFVFYNQKQAKWLIGCLICLFAYQLSILIKLVIFVKNTVC